MRFWYRVCYALVRIAFFFWHPVARFEGREQIPAGSAVICGNHCGAADPLWVLLALNNPDMIRIIAKKELRDAPVIGWIMEKFGIIFVDRGHHDTKAYDRCVEVLSAGEKLLVFPEGTRCRAGRRVRAKTGAVRMAAASGAPILPVYISTNRKPFSPVRVIFGQPMTVTLPENAEHERLQAEADRLMQTIYGLGGEQYAADTGEDSGILLRR